MEFTVHTLRPSELVAESRALLGAGWRLALVAGTDHGEDLEVAYLFVAGRPDRRVELRVPLEPGSPDLPSLARETFSAGRFERELADQLGVTPLGHPQLRPLVRHSSWPADYHPLRRGAGPAPTLDLGAPGFPFAPVEGPGVYEIPVGPVHAGLIEPGHFRFWVVGERILRMKARLWWLHRGIERHFEGRDLPEALALAERVAGDSALSHSLALVEAWEMATGVEVAEPVAAARAGLVELERLYNHVGDLGAMMNDVGYSLGQARAQVLREELLRLNAEVTGDRLLRGTLALGAVSLRGAVDGTRLASLAARVEEVAAMALEHSVVRDRFVGTGVLTPDAARELDVVGLVARASGGRGDARVDHPRAAALEEPLVEEAGDVAARFTLRRREAALAFARAAALVEPAAGGAVASRDEGVGHALVEGWRGPVAYRVEVCEGRATRVKVVDPSFFNWPALSTALSDAIVPDFPLVNKSFNLSYAGNDL